MIDGAELEVQDWGGPWPYMKVTNSLPYKIGMNTHNSGIMYVFQYEIELIG